MSGSFARVFFYGIFCNVFLVKGKNNKKAFVFFSKYTIILFEFVIKLKLVLRFMCMLNNKD